MRTASFTTIAVLILLALSCGCATAKSPDVRSAREFNGFPLYWLGERFEAWKLTTILGLDYKSLRALRSVNRVPPVIGPTGRIPPPGHGCTS